MASTAAPSNNDDIGDFQHARVIMEIMLDAGESGISPDLWKEIQKKAQEAKPVLFRMETLCFLRLPSPMSLVIYARILLVPRRASAFASLSTRAAQRLRTLPPLEDLFEATPVTNCSCDCPLSWTKWQRVRLGVLMAGAHFDAVSGCRTRPFSRGQ